MQDNSSSIPRNRRLGTLLSLHRYFLRNRAAGKDTAVHECGFGSVCTIIPPWSADRRRYQCQNNVEMGIPFQVSFPLFYAALA